MADRKNIDLLIETLSNYGDVGKDVTQLHPGFTVDQYEHIVYIVREKPGVVEILANYVSHDRFLRPFRVGEDFGTQELPGEQIRGKIIKAVNDIIIRGTKYIDVNVYWVD